ncbi:MAG: 50S ribosomal protein L16 [Candidatus Staskawiczbacteria bacterium RIFCSPHIGHO2_12_FULL_38_11]|uniref:Large ribosomal subunit protein uL16 n=1 Tax=Candidatus Staskawiczbacteria bacterium RIFCSPHIGHO2_12_FULL_38_11 TaxID=1802209 RepID=A0A1G2I678_9BACT|nr:MAG: 50S ribosomal protein L16 [Candidatus Staskawiczbacteria bacterium RIFCSPHIGHO2_12_FULL_38_11]
MTLLMPKKVKHRKWHRGVTKGVETRATQLNFGSFGLKSMGTKWVTARQIESARRHIIRYMKKGGKVWVRIFPDKPVTSKGEEVPLGGGKGGVHHYVYPIKPGRMIFEIDGLKEEVAREALKGAAIKLPIKTKFVKREG